MALTGLLAQAPIIDKSVAPVAPAAPQQSLGDQIWNTIGSNIKEGAQALSASASGQENPFAAGATIFKDVTGAVASPITVPLNAALDKTGISGALNTIAQRVNNTPIMQKFTDLMSQHPQLAGALSDVIQGAGNEAVIAGGAEGLQKGTNFVNAKVFGEGEVPPVNTPTLGNNQTEPTAQIDSATARTKAWNDIQPPATEDTVKAYRAQGNTTSAGTFKNTGLLPSVADKAVLDTVQPLYENGILKSEMTPEQKLSTLDNVSKQLTQQSDAYVNDHSVTSNVADLKDDLNIAKNNSDVIFAGNKTLETAYDTVVQNYLDKLKTTSTPETLPVIDAQTGETTSEGTPETPDQTTSIAKREALKQFDKEMQQKFPNAYKTKVTGELNPTDNARYNAIRDVHSTVQDNIKADMGENSPYSDLLNRNSKIITAKSMVNENATTVSKIAAYLKRNPLQAKLANRVVLGTASGLFLAGLGIYALRSQLTSAVKQLASGL